MYQDYRRLHRQHLHRLLSYWFQSLYSNISLYILREALFKAGFVVGSYKARGKINYRIHSAYLCDK